RPGRRHSCLTVCPRPPCAPPFPYTTLFRSVVHHDHVATVTGCRRVAGFVQRKHPLRLGLVFRTRACKIITGESEVVETRLVIGGFLGGCRGSDTELRVPGCTDLAHHTDLERSGQFGGESRGDEDAAPGEAGNDRITPVVAAQLRGEFDPGTVAIGERPQTRPLVHTPGLP